MNSCLYHKTSVVIDENDPSSPVYKYRFDTCPILLLEKHRWVWQFLRAYRWKEDGFLPSSGGMMSQSCVFLDSMDILSPELAEVESIIRERIIEEEKAKARRKHGNR